MLNSLQIVASAYGDQIGVNVVPSNYAATDGNTIKTVIDEENPEATWGFLKHEAAHIRFTDIKILQGKSLENLFNKQSKLIKNGVTFENFFSIINALEDNRIEYKMSRDYKGAFLTFDSMNSYLIKKGLWKAGMTSSLQDAAFQFLGFYAAGTVGGLNYPSCRELSQSCENVLLLFATNEQFLFLKQIALESVKSDSTMDIVNLALKCLYFLVEQLSKEQPENGKPDDNSDGKPDDNSDGKPDDNSDGKPDDNSDGKPDDNSNGKPDENSDGKPDDNSNGKPDENSNGKPDENSDGKPDDNSNGKPDDNSNGKPDDNSNGKPDDNSDGKPERIIEFNCEHQIVDKGDLISGALNSSKTKTQINPDLHEKPTRFSSFDKESKDRFSKGVSISGPLTNKIKHLLRARSRTSVIKANRGRKIDKRSLSKVKMGKNNVFIKKREGVSSNTAVYITSDISGSMKAQMNSEYSRLDASLQALSALINSISHYKNCDYALTTFNNSTQVIKAFGEKNKNVGAVIDRVKAHSYTEISNSLVYGAKSFASVRGKYNRNVMIVITDGTPSDHIEAQEIIKKIRSSNIDVFAFGIALDDVAESKMRQMFTTHFVNLSDPNLLQQEIVKVAEVIL